MTEGKLISADEWKTFEKTINIYFEIFYQRQLEIIEKLKEANMKNTYKLIILYDNGKEYKVNGVYSHEFKTLLANNGNNIKKLVYRTYTKATKAYVVTEIPARDIAAITIKNQNSINIEKFKPCARISGKAEKK